MKHAWHPSVARSAAFAAFAAVGLAACSTKSNFGVASDSGTESGDSGKRADAGNTADAGSSAGDAGSTEASGTGDGGTDAGGTGDGGTDAGGSQTNDIAALAYDAWNSAFLVRDGQRVYYAKQATSIGMDPALMYTGALDIAVAEDVYQQTHSKSQRELLVSLLDTYLMLNGEDWTYDGWNDDIGWMANAFIRGYLYTGNAQYLTVAETNWNMAYDRGWDGNLGGGIWENTDKPGKEALSNNPFVWEGVILSQLTGDGTYLSKAEDIYAWVRTNLVNTTDGQNNLGEPGQVNQGLKADGTLNPGDGVYNAGAFIDAATILYRATGNQQYYDDAVRTIKHIVQEQPILNSNQEACGCQWSYWFTHGLSQFATVANLWTQYLPYLQTNASAAWSMRNNANLTWNDWTTRTSDSVAAGNPDEVEMESAVAIWQHLPPPSVHLSGSYEIQNVASGLALTVEGNSLANDAAVIQAPFVDGAKSALWTFVPTSGGYYQIKNVNSGLVVNVAAVSALSGAKVVQWPASGMRPGNDQWLPVPGADGTYSFYNLNSSQALDNPAASTVSGTQLQQWFGNSSAGQAFRLIPHQ